MISKKCWLIFTGLLLLMAGSGKAQTLFTYGNTKVSKSEFLQAFKKNNSDLTPTPKAYEEYLELFIRYKLKIAGAYAQQLDTLPSIQMEWSSFMNDVGLQYVNDDSTFQALTKEALRRSLVERNISHIYVAAGSDTLGSFQKINKASAALKAGQSFSEVALQFSDDPTVQKNKGLIGWVSVFTLPYALENIAYTTTINSFSPVVRTAQAYHIFYINGERPAKGKTTIAQILLEPPAQGQESVEKKADSLYHLLQKGAEFAQLARQFSDDNSSYSSGGELPPFTAGTFEQEFEKEIEKLQKPGDISVPIKSLQGIHILKLLAREGVPDSANNEVREEIRNNVLASDRNRLPAEVAYQKAKRLVKFQLLPVKQNRTTTTAFALIGKRELTEGEFQLYREDQVKLREENGQQLSEEQDRNNYIKQQVMQEYLTNLAQYNPAFAAQVADFREGTLIFESMQQQVWDKASADEEGLLNYYNQHSNKYTWKESCRGVLFTCPDSSIAGGLYRELLTNPSRWPEITIRYKNIVLADTGRFELDQLPVPISTNSVMAGVLTKPVQVNGSEQYGFLYCIEKLPGRQARAFDDARGFVLNDYQQQLEEEWIVQLKKTFPVNVNKSVLKSLNR